MAITPNRIWIALFGIALLSFAGCALGAVDCSIFKPIGLSAALGAAVVSFFDTGAPVREEVRVEE